MNRAQISGVVKDSIADELGLKAGDVIISINGKEIEDELELRFYEAAEFITLEVEIDGEREIIDIENPDMESLGVEFESALFGNAKHCSNKCIFCFIDQMPPGMRETLYFKDDDSRLSFLTGNYVTLTNVRDEDIDKIIKMRMEPVNVSVHATNPELRVRLLKNPKAADLKRHMKRLADGRIHMNCQVVLMPEINDGAELDRTFSDLSELYPYVSSVCVVPVGITKYREGLCPLRNFTSDESRAVIEQIYSWQEKFLDKIGTRFVYAADEFYLSAGVDIPPEEEYEGYPQLDNGVGLIRGFRDEFMQALDKAPKGARKVDLVTGYAAYEELLSLSDKAMKRYGNVKITVHRIRNDFFGETITVAGLVTGGDIIKQLSGSKLTGTLIIPDCMLRSGTDVFLDDCTVGDIEKALGVKILVTTCDGQDLWERIISDE